MHGVRVELLEAQALAADLPLIQVPIPAPCPNETYDAAMRAAMDRARADGVADIVFGDLYLEDIRRYRLDRLTPIGMRCRFPIWRRDTDRLAREMIDAGLRATLVCVDPRKLSPDFAGRDFDRNLLRDLPADVDPCGENGEFHTFAWAGPMFRAPVYIKVGERVSRGGFVFVDLQKDLKIPA